MTSAARSAFAVLTFLTAAGADASPPGATPSWSDTPALVASATAPVDDALRACVGSHVPSAVTIIATRARDGSTSVAMPMPPVGIRGFTDEERCLMKTIARIALPPLPAGIDRIELGHVIAAPGAAPPATEPAFDDWRDPGAAVAALLDVAHRAQLAACDHKRRTVRLVLDRRKDATRVWLPAWQFHSDTGDGTTPPAERRVKACLTAAIRDWHPPTLPHAMGALELAIAVQP